MFQYKLEFRNNRSLHNAAVSFNAGVFEGSCQNCVKETVRFAMSVDTPACPHGTTWLPRDGFS